MSFDRIERKILRPPAAHNVARLLDPSCEIKTTQNIARFAVGIPSFNYLPATKVCIDRVALGIDLSTALKAVGQKGAPAGREHNASLVRAFWQFDEERAYSKLRMLDNYDGQFRISREIAVPTSPTFTVLEKSKQVPVVLCGWKDFALVQDQVRAWLTILESGLFSFADYRSSPWEVILLPEEDGADGKTRRPLVIRRGDYSLFSEEDMRELASMYSRAQRAAMPIAREMWEKRERRRREKQVDLGDIVQPGGRDGQGDLFAKDHS